MACLMVLQACGGEGAVLPPTPDGGPAIDSATMADSETASDTSAIDDRAAGDGTIAVPDANVRESGSLPECPPEVAQWQACTVSGEQCVSHCNACGTAIFTTDPIVWQCSPNPAAMSKLEWTTFDEVDCFPASGSCPGEYSDPQCKVPLSCPACGQGSACSSPSECCQDTTCIGNTCQTPAHACQATNEACDTSIPCCGGKACNVMTNGCSAGSCQAAGHACTRTVECCAGTCGTSGTCG